MFKIGDYVKCVNNKDCPYLILNEIYIITFSRPNVILKNRTVCYVNNKKNGYDDYHFEYDIKYNRNKKLKNIEICSKEETS